VATVELSQALEFVRGHNQGVLTTIRRDGRAQLSNIVYVTGDDGVTRISVTDGRAKTKNLRRDARASLYVLGANFWEWVVLDGTTELSPVAAKRDDATVDELVALYRALRGEHESWDEYRAVMVRDQRLVIRFAADHAYGILPS
jgi:PPOX class probable F420-dependent enzyme